MHCLIKTTTDWWDASGSLNIKKKIKSLKRVDTQVQSVVIVGEESEVATNV